MLVTRHLDTEQHHWSSKLETAFHKSTSPRMSSYDGHLSTQPDWQGQYAFLPPGEGSIFAQSFEQVSGSNSNNNVASQQRPSSAHNSNPESTNQTNHSRINSPMSHHRILDPLGLRQPKAESPVQEQPDVQGASYAIKAESAHEESLASADHQGLHLGQNTISSTSSAGQGQESTSIPAGNEEAAIGKDEDDDVLEDDEMVEADGDVTTQPQTAAERTAARRKMKRFR